MKPKKIIILTIIVLFGIMGATVCCRHDISYQQICCIKNPDSKDNANTLFYPYGFVLLHDSIFLQSYRGINENTLRIADNVGQWDFEKYSYLITYGNNVEQLSYSWLDTFIYDESPSYAKCWKEGKQLLIVDYAGFNYRQHSPFNDNAIKGNDSIYVYWLPHSPFLRGLQD